LDLWGRFCLSFANVELLPKDIRLPALACFLRVFVSYSLTHFAHPKESPMSNTQPHHRAYKKRGKWKPRFLAALAKSGVVRQAAEEAGVQYQTVFIARDLHNRSGANLAEAQAFAKAWDDALAEAADSVEIEIRRRAIQGVERERAVFYRGEQIGTQVILLYSDRLLMFLARALHPEVYGEHPRTPPPPPNPSAEVDRLAALDEIARKRWQEAIPVLLPLLNLKPDSSPESTPPQTFESESEINQNSRQ
jgi:hypothetical protein